MCCPTGRVLGFHCSWGAHNSCDGLWLLCGHLSPPALHGVVSLRIFLLLVSFTYLYGFCTLIVTSSSVSSVTYCSCNIISHFYCDIVPLLTLSCSDTSFPEAFVFMSASTNLVFSIITVHVSYFNIILFILKIHSSEGRKKEFSTCASHMMAISHLYDTMIFMYAQPQTKHSMDIDKMASVFHMIVISMLNPMIYSLRNKDVKAALKRFLTNSFCFFKLM